MTLVLEFCWLPVVFCVSPEHSPSGGRPQDDFQRASFGGVQGLSGYRQRLHWDWQLRGDILGISHGKLCGSFELPILVCQWRRRLLRGCNLMDWWCPIVELGVEWYRWEVDGEIYCAFHVRLAHTSLFVQLQILMRQDINCWSTVGCHVLWSKTLLTSPSLLLRPSNPSCSKLCREFEFFVSQRICWGQAPR